MKRGTLWNVGLTPTSVDDAITNWAEREVDIALRSIPKESCILLWEEKDKWFVRHVAFDCIVTKVEIGKLINEAINDRAPYGFAKYDGAGGIAGMDYSSGDFASLDSLVDQLAKLTATATRKRDAMKKKAGLIP